MSFYETLGYLAALGSAIAWAFGSILFRRVGEEASPIGMNLGKCILGTFFLGTVLLIIGIEPIDIHTFLILGVSGLLGIALGDTFFFKALISLGPRTTVLLGTLGPVFTVILAVIFLHERLSALAWIGASLTLAGVSLVLWEGSPEETVNKKWGSGILYALLAMICTSLGIIIAKIGLAKAPPLQATFIRILWGAIGLTLWGFINRQLGNWTAPFKKPSLLKLIIFAVVVVVFGGFWLSLVALKYIDASIATILNSTEPIFILPMAVFILKEKITIQGIAGAVVAVFGVTLIFIG